MTRDSLRSLRSATTTVHRFLDCTTSAVTSEPADPGAAAAMVEREPIEAWGHTHSA